MAGFQLTQSDDFRQWNRPLARLVSLALLVLLIWQFAQLFWLLTAPDSNQLLEPPGHAQAPGSAPQQAYAIDRYHLFGEYRTAPAVELYRNAPETPLNLELRGIVAGTEPDQGFAIIRDAQGREGAFRVDTDIPGDARVVGVYPDRVVLRRGGSYETLRLPSDADLGDSPWTARVTNPATEKATIPGLRPVSAALPDARRLLTVNLAALSSSYGLLPVSTGGYRLSLGRDAKQLVELGLQNGDIIVAANGVSLDDEQAVQQLFEQILDGRQLSLQVRRSGETLMLQPDLSKVLRNRESGR